jgi:proteasome lid subunit RPN8/RPN11
MIMWEPTDKILKDAVAHAEEMQPRESCGVVAGGKYHRLDNLDSAINSFVMYMRAYLVIDRKTPVQAVVHSHVHQPPLPSEADRAMCEATAKPWLIVSWPDGTWQVTEPTGYKAPLVGRSFVWNCQDCWTLTRDAFERFTGVDMPEIFLPWEFWQDAEKEIVLDYYERAGLVIVDDPEWRHCDIAAMQVWPSRIINHLGLILYPDILLHQLGGQLSVREIYGGFYAKCTRHHLRHKDFLDAAPALPDDYEQWRANPS